MNRRHFLFGSIAAGTAVPKSGAQARVESGREVSRASPATGQPRVAVLLVDTDRAMAAVDERIYGHFLEHINHSVEDGLFAEQLQGCGFEGEDFATYWKPFSDRGSVEIAEVEFKNGQKSVRLHVAGGRAGIRQSRIYVDAGFKYDGSLWVKREEGSPQLALRIVVRRATRSRRYRLQSETRTGTRLAMPLPVSCGIRKPRWRSPPRGVERCCSTSSR